METCEDPCPRCQGTMTSPYRLHTDSGWALTVSCMNCGHYIFHPIFYMDYTERKVRQAERETLRSEHKAVRVSNGRISRVMDLSKYDFGSTV